MLRLYMRKQINFIIIFFCIVSSVSAKEPLVARLESTISNEIQKFAIGNYTFICKPYGVITLQSINTIQVEF